SSSQHRLPISKVGGWNVRIGGAVPHEESPAGVVARSEIVSKVVAHRKPCRPDAYSGICAAVSSGSALIDRVPCRGVADGGSAAIFGVGRIGQAATAGSPTRGSSLTGAILSSVM